MGKYNDVMQYLRPSDKAIDWEAEYERIKKVPGLANDLTYFGLTLVEPQDCLMMFRRGMGGSGGVAHKRTSPQGVKLYYVTYSREWFKCLMKMVPPDIFQREWFTILCHEYAHILCLNGSDRANDGHSWVWAKLATTMCGKADRIVGNLSYKNAEYNMVPGTRVRWVDIHDAAQQLVEHDKQVKFQAELAGYASKQH